ncbi:hypothetical protein ACIBL3_18200 [Kribbella sp. NPDC050124]|uniref:hypothetical protein n=1 Tax=Kribbella sp. NPDC050124 TaxID=3364114 RepID=UPI0037A5DFEF
MKHLEQITAAVEAGRAGDRESARNQLARLWDTADDRRTRCAIAHYLADVQDDTEDELVWDLRALEEVDPADAGMLPSLYLNLADDYRRLGDAARAEEHLSASRARLDLLADDAYGDVIRGGVDHVAAALAAGSTRRLETNPST